MTDLNTKTQRAFGRQSGAASVPVLFFLFLLVLFLGAAFLAYSATEKNKELENKNAELRSENSLVGARKGILDDYTKSLKEVLGMSGTFEGPDSAVYRQLDGVTIDQIAIAGGPLASDISTTIDTFLRTPAGAGLTNKSSLSLLLTDVGAKIESLKKRAADAEAARDAERARAESLVAANTESNSKRTDEVNREISKREQEVQALRDSIQERNTQIDVTNARFRELRDQMTAANAEHQERVRQLRSEIDLLQASLDARSQLVASINPPEQADGLILSASSTTGRAWINLGQRDMLPIGTGFEIIDPRDGHVKGQGVVRQVQNDRSELAITRIADQYDPIRQDDQVRNDLYSPNLRRNIYLMGRYVAPYTRPVVKAQLEALGNRVVDELSPAVDLVLVGADTVNDDGSGFTPLMDTDEFKMATFLRLEMRPVTKVRQFLDPNASAPR